MHIHTNMNTCARAHKHTCMYPHIIMLYTQLRAQITTVHTVQMYVNDCIPHTHLHTYVHTLHLHTYVHTYIHYATHTHLRTYIHYATHTYLHTSIHYATLTHLHTSIHYATLTHLHTYIHYATHAHLHTYIHYATHTHLHTYIWNQELSIWRTTPRAVSKLGQRRNHQGQLTTTPAQ